MTCETCASSGSEARRRSRMPVVQNSSRVSRVLAASRRTWYLGDCQEQSLSHGEASEGRVRERDRKRNAVHARANEALRSCHRM